MIRYNNVNFIVQQYSTDNYVTISSYPPNKIKNWDQFIKTLEMASKKTLKESIEDILKPKSEEEIEKNIKKLSGEDLYNLWDDSGDKEFLKRALKKGINIGDLDIAEILESVNGEEEYEELLFPYILENFPIGEIKKVNKKYNLYFSGWDEFSSLFRESREIDEESINKILSGDSYEFFQRYDDYIRKLSDVYIGSLKINDSVNKELKNLISKRLNNPPDLKNKNTFDELYNYIEEHEKDPQLEDIVKALKFTIYDTQEVADESAAYNEIVHAIKSELNFKEPKVVDHHLVVPIDKETIINIFKMAHNINDKIGYWPPQYGWYGNISDHPDVFQDCLVNRLDDIENKLNESIKDILVPKSIEDIRDTFDTLKITSQIEFLEDDFVSEEENKKRKEIIPFNKWPLILQIRERLKSNKKFNSKFRCTSIDIHISNRYELLGSIFKIYPKDYSSNILKIIQLNKKPQHIEIVYDITHTKFFTSYNQFIKWFNKYWFINEALGDILKPKSEKDVIETFSYLSLSEQVKFLNDEENRKLIPKEKWPLIVKIHDELYRKKLPLKYDILANVLPIVYYPEKFEPITVGFYFKIIRDIPNFRYKVPEIHVEQSIENSDSVEIYMKNIDTNKKSQRHKIKTTEELVNWLKDIGYENSY